MTSQDLHHAADNLRPAYLVVLVLIVAILLVVVLLASRRVAKRLKANCPPHAVPLSPGGLSPRRWWALLCNKNVRWEEIYPPKSLPYIAGRSSQAGSQTKAKRRDRPRRKHGAPAGRQKR
jgi:hypothetical protein